MKNREKYKEDFVDAILSGVSIPFIHEKITGRYGEYKYSTTEELLLFVMWLDEEYVEPEVDWSKVEVDTPILVGYVGSDSLRRYFAKYQNGKVYAWVDGQTSWSENGCESWPYAKLAEEESDD